MLRVRYQYIYKIQNSIGVEIFDVPHIKRLFNRMAEC